MPIDIDPVTGAVVVTPASEMNLEGVGNKTTSTGSGFEVPNKPADAIPAAPVKEPLTGMDHRIEEAKKFNSNLAMKDKVRELTNKQPVEQTISKDEQLRNILRMYGMDSQQASKAFAEIKALYS